MCICSHSLNITFYNTSSVERYNETWNATYLRSWSEDNFGSGDDLYEQYSRPVYSYVGGVPEWDESDRGVVGEGIRTVIYSGNRWFATYIVRENETSYEDLMYAAMEYHGELLLLFGLAHVTPISKSYSLNSWPTHQHSGVKCTQPSPISFPIRPRGGEFQFYSAHKHCSISQTVYPLMIYLIAA